MGHAERHRNRHDGNVFFPEKVCASSPAHQIIGFEAAARIIGEQAAALPSESISLDQAAWRVLSADLVARRPSPFRAVSAMDGYAVRDSDLANLPASLPIAGHSFAGHGFHGPLPYGSCVRVFTGAALPDGSDRVIIQEDVVQSGGTAHFSEPLAEHRHLRRAASDFSRGDRLLAAGSLLTPQRLVAAVAADRACLQVHRQPRVAILCCGDELTEPGQAGEDPDRIPESLSYGVAALVQVWGAVVFHRRRCKDDLATLKSAARQAAAQADIVVVIGGASVGEKDFAKDAFPGLRFLFTKVAIKPGKPVWFGKDAHVLVMGLPGNPTSAMVTARLFLAPLVAGLSGRGFHDAWRWQDMRLGSPMDASDGRDCFIRATASADLVRPITDQDSGSQKALGLATHLIRRRAGAPAIGPGEMVETLIL
jgi:molybdopterin molybdotransferase